MQTRSAPFACFVGLALLTACSDIEDADSDAATDRGGLSASELTIFDVTAPTSISPDGSANELGVRFKSDVAGQITAIRFYKGPGNGGAHTGHLWTATGSLLGTVTFTNESATGWQKATFANPIPVQANVVYVASYFAPQGHYAHTVSQFASAGIDRAPLHALKDGVAGPNGIYAQGASRFPTSSYRASNYWVDVAFAPPAQTVSTVAVTDPAEGATVSGALTVRGTASGDLSKVEVQIDSGAFALATGLSSFSYALDTTTVANGPHTATVRAVSRDGSTQSVARKFNVDNLACSGVAIAPGENIQAKLDAGGTAFCLKSGVHRLTTAITLRANQTLRGEVGAILSGARVASSWTASGSYWFASGLLPTAYAGVGQCEDEVTNPCRLAEEVFIDDQHLTRVMSLSALAPGKFYGDYAANRVYIASNPSGHMVEVGRTPVAIRATAAGMTIDHVTIEKFATTAQQGAVFVENGAVLRNSELRFNHAAGVMAMGTGSQVIDNRIHHNGQLGVAGHRSTSFVVSGNELAWNNTDGFYIGDWEAGGIKVTYSGGAIRNNHVHDNKGIGVWVDIDNRNILIEDNRIINNATDGIRYEISYDGIIRNNVVTGNAFGIGRGCNGGEFDLYCTAGININTSSNVELYGNQLKDNIHGISVQWRNRGSGELGLWDLKNVYVHDNTVTLGPGQFTGLVQLKGDGSVFTTKNNRFANNTYHLDSLTAQKFAWQNGYRTKEAWKGYGQDTTGTFLSP
jgi:parallel beta-helix repeat protein